MDSRLGVSQEKKKSGMNNLDDLYMLLKWRSGDHYELTRVP